MSLTFPTFCIQFSLLQTAPQIVLLVHFWSEHAWPLTQAHGRSAFVFWPELLILYLFSCHRVSVRCCSWNLSESVYKVPISTLNSLPHGNGKHSTLPFVQWAGYSCLPVHASHDNMFILILRVRSETRWPSEGQGTPMKSCPARSALLMKAPVAVLAGRNRRTLWLDPFSKDSNFCISKFCRAMPVRTIAMI